MAVSKGSDASRIRVVGRGLKPMPKRVEASDTVAAGHHPHTKERASGSGKRFSPDLRGEMLVHGDTRKALLAANGAMGFYGVIVSEHADHDHHRNQDPLHELFRIASRTSKQISANEIGMVLSHREARVLVYVLERMRAPETPGDLSATEIVERISSAIPENTGSEWDQLIGPFYTTASLATLRGVSRQAIHKMRANHKLLSVKTSDDKLLFPTFQFDITGKPVPHLKDVLRILSEDSADGWAMALWLTGPVDAWDGKTAVAKLATGKVQDFQDVLDAARETVMVRGTAREDAELRHSAAVQR